MAKFSIKSPTGTVLYEGTPSFNGQYMKPGSITFRQISSPSVINFLVGSYLDYSIVVNGNETRTGWRYYMYATPQLKKQARPNSVGDAFVYDSVTLYDASKQLDFVPFRDYVVDDNNVHFSTQESFSTYEDVAGIARRIQSCIDALYPNSWIIEVATGQDVPEETAALMLEVREFSVSGVTVLGALGKIYDVWKEIGWVFSERTVNGVRKNVITIGGAGLVGTTQNYQYGKGNGLKNIQRNVANDGEIVNRLYAYGNTTNLPRRYYNGKNILHADSVDIQNLMIPISSWGVDQATNKPSPLIAYIDDATSQAKNGIRPRYVYFDGNNDLDDIYPTVKGMTVKNIRDYISGGGSMAYAPTASWQNTQRLDTVLHVYPNPENLSDQTFDSGREGDDEHNSIDKVFKSDAEESSFTVNQGGNYIDLDWLDTTIYGGGHTYEKVQAKVSIARCVIEVKRSLIHLFLHGMDGRITLELYRYKTDEYGDITDSKGFIRKSFNLQWEWVSFLSNRLYLNIEDITIETDVFSIASADEKVGVNFELELDYDGSDPISVDYSVDMEFSGSLIRNVVSNFMLTVPPIGFDLKDIAATDSEIQLMMVSGKCAGRAFTVTNTSLIESDNSWKLSLKRSLDDSLAQYFPNYDYPVEIGDNFVILGISMPEVYITAAESRLLAAAQAYLDMYSTEMWQYVPEIDSKFMAENGRMILPAQNMTLVDANIIDGGSETILVDSVTIDESAAEIPSFRVTLRDRKRGTSGHSGGSSAGNAGGVVVIGGGGSSSSEWYNIKATKDSNGDLAAIIENYTSALANSNKYRMFLVRWRKGSAKPRYHSWHVPFFSHAASGYNNIAEANRSWPITSNEQVMFATTGDDYTDVLPLLTIQRTHYDNKYVFKNTRNRKMRFGCAIFKNTGVGTYGWQRVSNIAEFELFLQDDGTRMLSIRK